MPDEQRTLRPLVVEVAGVLFVACSCVIRLNGPIGAGSQLDVSLINPSNSDRERTFGVLFKPVGRAADVDD
jgi:hypothetical protein